jgi:hypothetical protein
MKNQLFIRLFEFIFISYIHHIRLVHVLRDDTKEKKKKKKKFRKIKFLFQDLLDVLVERKQRRRLIKIG